MKEEEQERYRKLVLLIYDEIGISRKYEFAKGLRIIQKLTSGRRERKNRVHLLLCGYLFQIPPVRSN